MNRTALTSRRKLAIAGLAVSLPLLLAGCGFDAQTNQVYQPAVGNNNRSEDVDVLAGVVVSPAEGEGVVLATLVNGAAGTDRLTGITAADGTKVGTVKSVELPPQTPVDLQDADITIAGDQVNSVRSNYVLLTFEFENSNPVKINVPVVPNTGPYADIATAPPATPDDVASEGAAGATETPGASGEGE